MKVEADELHAGRASQICHGLQSAGESLLGREAISQAGLQLLPELPLLLTDGWHRTLLLTHHSALCLPTG
ncbi:MAG: hypothetical protein ACE5I9_10360 [Candidatus Methylomirabilales bacterium]